MAITLLQCGLRSITIPQNVTNFGEEFFAGCTSLSDVAFLCEPKEISEDVPPNCVIFVKPEYYDNWKDKFDGRAVKIIE